MTSNPYQQWIDETPKEQAEAAWVEYNLLQEALESVHQQINNLPGGLAKAVPKVALAILDQWEEGISGLLENPMTSINGGGSEHALDDMRNQLVEIGDLRAMVIRAEFVLLTGALESVQLQIDSLPGGIFNVDRETALDLLDKWENIICDLLVNPLITLATEGNLLDGILKSWSMVGEVRAMLSPDTSLKALA